MNIKLLFFAATALLVPSVVHATQPPICKPDKSAGWLNNYDLTSVCRYSFPAPVSGRSVEFDFEGRFVLMDFGTEADLAPFAAPSQFARSPDGRYFNINDGQWSGQLFPVAGTC